MITGLSHINLLVPPGTLPLATAFYSTTLGLTPRPVPAHRVHDLAWFEIGDSGQEVHIAPDYNGSNGTYDSPTAQVSPFLGGAADVGYDSGILLCFVTAAISAVVFI